MKGIIGADTLKRTLKTEAIVLRKRSLPNQDVIVTLLTKELGKINTIAKGIKKIFTEGKVRLIAHILVFLVLYSTIVGMSVANIGTLVRFRDAMLPIFAILSSFEDELPIDINFFLPS